MAQGILYNFSPAGAEKEKVIMAAYNAPYSVASEGAIYSIGIRYHIPLDLGPLEGLDIYNDYAYLDKRNTNFSDSQMNVFGVGITFGPIYTYIDWASGINHSWLGADYNNAFAEGIDNDNWDHRFNINFGYYF